MLIIASDWMVQECFDTTLVQYRYPSATVYIAKVVTRGLPATCRGSRSRTNSSVSFLRDFGCVVIVSLMMAASNVVTGQTHSNEKEKRISNVLVSGDKF